MNLMDEWNQAPQKGQGGESGEKGRRGSKSSKGAVVNRSQSDTCKIMHVVSIPNHTVRRQCVIASR